MREKDECVCVAVCQSWCPVALRQGGEKRCGGGRRRVGDGVCEVTGEGGRSDGVLDGGRARGDECVLTV